MEANKSGNKKLICPGCSGALHDVYVEASYGRVLIVDQCMDCGSVWFDRWELYFTKESSIRSLEALDIKNFIAENPHQKGRGECPRCAQELIPFTDPLLPKDASIKRCPKCSGLWLNRGDLGRYASHRETFKGAPSRARSEAELKTLRHLQRELDTTKIAALPTLTELELAAQAEDGSVETREVVKDIGFLILQSLVRLVFKI